MGWKVEIGNLKLVTFNPGPDLAQVMMIYLPLWQNDTFQNNET